MSFKAIILQIARNELKVQKDLGMKSSKQWFRSLLVHYTRTK